MNELNKFVFGSFDSLDHGIIMTAPPPIVFAERDVETICVAGRSGDIIKDNRRYKNVTIPYTCALFPMDGFSLRDTAITAVTGLRMASGYQKIEDTYNPNQFRVARVSGNISIDSIVEQAGKFTLTFDCKPQRWLKSGQFPIVFDKPSTIYNRGEDTNPIITVYGDGAGSVTVGAITVEIKYMTDKLILDCDTQNAYRQDGDGALENLNGSIYAPQFPALAPGKNAVTWTGGVTKIEIIPRWWTL